MTIDISDEYRVAFTQANHRELNLQSDLYHFESEVVSPEK